MLLLILKDINYVVCFFGGTSLQVSLEAEPLVTVSLQIYNQTHTLMYNISALTV